MLAMLLLAFTLLFQAADDPRVEVSPTTFQLEVDQTRQLEATAYDETGARIADATFRWFSADRSIATVDRAGVVTAHRPGTTRILARASGTTGTATVTVPQLPPATLALRAPEQTVRAGMSLPLHVTATTRLGDVLPQPRLQYETSNPQVAMIDATGRIYGRQPGTATLTVRGGTATETIRITVAENPATHYEMTPTQADVRTGDVVRFRVVGQTASGETMADIRPAWSVASTGAQIEEEGYEGVFVAEEPGTYIVTALIGQDAARTAVVNVAQRQYNARIETIGRGPIARYNSADTWVFEGVDGRDYAYIGTYMHDWMMAWDVTDPGNPVLTDSIQVDARRINDVKIHPNNRLAIITREGASDRRNGIVLLDLSDPAHPTIAGTYTATVTGGVHNVWMLGEKGDHDLVYAVHNGTSDIHILDIQDPQNVQEVGRWGLEDHDGKSLHDVIWQDGYAYLSYWDDGIVTLDAGAGTHGGTPTKPVLVSRYAYPIGNTHTAWRHGRYLFVGDEIFPSDWNSTAPIEARGYIHVFDMTDMDNPVEVAKYEVPEAGAHNVWVEGDRLYIGYYQGGLRVVDISGELRGDLYQQGREVAHLKTTDSQAFVPNWPMTFSAQIFKGLIYSADFNSGLWITRLIEEDVLP